MRAPYKVPQLLAIIIAVALLLTTVSIATLLAQTAKPATSDPSLGTWVLNSQKSKLGGPAPKAFIERYDLRPDGFIVSTRSVIAPDGSPAFEQAVLKLDGKDYEWWDNTTLADFLATGKRAPKTLSAKAIDVYTADYVGKQVGKVTVTGRRTISKDGKTMTLVAKSRTPQGQEVEVIAVFDKQ
jgi:hypothetical protein